MADGFGLAWGFKKPKPPQARPKLGLSGQAGPEHHYFLRSPVKIFGASPFSLVVTIAGCWAIATGGTICWGTCNCSGIGASCTTGGGGGI